LSLHALRLSHLFWFMIFAIIFMHYIAYEETFMAILQVRDIDDHLYEALKSAASASNRSISQEVVVIKTLWMHSRLVN
jgi:hypothetical protein